MHENGEHQVSKTMKAELQIILGQGQIFFRVKSFDSKALNIAKMDKIDFRAQIWSCLRLDNPFVILNRILIAFEF